MLKLKHVSRETHEKLLFEVVPTFNRIHMFSYFDTQSATYDIRFDTKNMTIHLDYSSITDYVTLTFNGLSKIGLSLDEVEVEIT